MKIRSIILLALLASLLTAAASATPKDKKNKVEFEGFIETLPVGSLTGDWTVSGRTVHVTASTHIKQDRGIAVDIGVFVEVRGTLMTDGSVDATDIDVEAGLGAIHEARFTGFVTTLPAAGLIGDWVVKGRTVRVSNATHIKMEHGLVAVNAFVEVKGFPEADGSVTADDITVDASPGNGREFDFEGFVGKLPAGGLTGDWTVDGHTVHVAAATRLKQEQATAALNAFVDVKGILLGDGTINATEIEVEAAPGSSRQFDFHGFIDKLPDSGLIGDWTVDGHTIHVAGDTHVHQENGIAAENAFVRVTGMLLADGSIAAKDVRVEASPVREGRVKLDGFVEQLPIAGLIGDWIVSGRKVHVSVDTSIKRKKSLVVAVGSLVEVNGVLEADGTITAGKIKLKL